ncbi:MAG: GxxExxY protein [Magnetococcus sp. THC-1_WYH]
MFATLKDIDPQISQADADFVYSGKIIVAFKAMQRLTGNEYAQVINDLKIFDLHCAFLLNFGTQCLKQKRLVFNLRLSADKNLHYR